MKKILLASTMLVGTAGFAAADVSLSGSAYTGVGYSFANGFNIDYSVALVASMMTTTDGGLEVGASAVLVTPSYVLQKDPTDDEFGLVDVNTGGATVSALVPASSIYLSGSWGKVTVAYDINADDGSATPGDWDLTATYSNSWGNFDLEAYAVWAPATSTATTSGDFGAKATYNFGDYSIYAGYDNDAGNHEVYVGGSATFSAFTVNAEVGYDVGAAAISWEADAAYTTGAWTIAVFVNDDIDYGGSVAYDLGGGVTLSAGYARDATSTDSVVYAGVGMRF